MIDLNTLSSNANLFYYLLYIAALFNHITIYCNITIDYRKLQYYFEGDLGFLVKFID